MTNGFSSMVAGAGDKGVALLRATFIPVKVLQRLLERAVKCRHCGPRW